MIVLSITTLLLHGVFATSLSSVIKRQAHEESFLRDPSCSGEQFDFFGTEYFIGVEYANRAYENMKPGFQLDTYFEKESEDPELLEYIKENFLNGFRTVFTAKDKIKIRCGSASHPECAAGAPEASNGRQRDWAFTTADEKTITLCDDFFSLKPSPPAFQLQLPGMSFVDFCADQSWTIDNFLTATWILMHEYTHLRLTMVPKTEDYAYGSGWSVVLGSTYPEAARLNADSYMYVAMGTYWSWRCGRDIEATPEDEYGTGDPPWASDNTFFDGILPS